MDDGLSTGQLIGLIAPLALIQFGLMAFAIYDLVKTDRIEEDRKWIWGVIIVVVNIIGPILYFLVGRRGE
jgi:hypothetical protein